jgi:colanic acid biosynthesis protein WcaH
MNIHEAIELLNKQILNPSMGLPEEVFLFISRITPMVNVDLLIKDENRRTLLSWRDDQFAGTGWHLPGGIVRFKEKLEKRVLKVAETEIGATVEYDPVPLAFNQVICDYDMRGHFISILYKCFLSGKYVPKNRGLTEKDKGYLKWHDSCPANLIKVHKIYRNYI